MPDISDHFVLICATCTGGQPVDALQKALATELPAGFSVRMTRCMAGCAHPRTVGFQAAGKAQYLFGDIQSTQDVQALAAFARQYRSSADGWTNATDRPRPLLHKTLSRMPRVEHGVPV